MLKETEDEDNLCFVGYNAVLSVKRQGESDTFLRNVGWPSKEYARLIPQQIVSLTTATARTSYYRNTEVAIRPTSRTANRRYVKTHKQTNKQTPWPLVYKRTVPTERPPLVDEI
jgi:hypothetical protein